MKKTLIILILVFINSTSYAETEEDFEPSGFGGLGFSIGKLNDEDLDNIYDTGIGSLLNIYRELKNKKHLGMSIGFLANAMIFFPDTTDTSLGSWMPISGGVGYLGYNKNKNILFFIGGGIGYINHIWERQEIGSKKKHTWNIFPEIAVYIKTGKEFGLYLNGRYCYTKWDDIDMSHIVIGLGLGVK